MLSREVPLTHLAGDYKAWVLVVKIDFKFQFCFICLLSDSSSDKFYFTQTFSVFCLFMNSFLPV